MILRVRSRRVHKPCDYEMNGKASLGLTKESMGPVSIGQGESEGQKEVDADGPERGPQSMRKVRFFPVGQRPAVRLSLVTPKTSRALLPRFPPVMNALWPGR